MKKLIILLLILLIGCSAYEQTTGETKSKAYARIFKETIDTLHDIVRRMRWRSLEALTRQMDEMSSRVVKFNNNFGGELVSAHGEIEAASKLIEAANLSGAKAVLRKMEDELTILEKTMEKIGTAYKETKQKFDRSITKAEANASNNEDRYLKIGTAYEKYEEMTEAYSNMLARFEDITDNEGNIIELSDWSILRNSWRTQFDKVIRLENEKLDNIRLGLIDGEVPLLYADKLRLSRDFAGDLRNYVDIHRGGDRNEIDVMPNFIKVFTKDLAEDVDVTRKISAREYKIKPPKSAPPGIYQFRAIDGNRGFLCLATDGAIVLLSIGEVKNSGGAQQTAINRAPIECDNAA